ncbi:unnamed protein product, partial [Symbiodinium sp. KB8]
MWSANGKRTGKHPCARQDLAAARRARELALDLTAYLQKQLLELEDSSSEKAEEVKQELNEAKKELREANREVDKAKQEVEKASASKGFTRICLYLVLFLVEVSQAAEFFGKLLFDDTKGWPLTDAGYQSSRSCIVDLGRGPFSGALASGKQEKSNLLDRDTEMQYVVKKVAARAKDLKGRVNSDKTASPALLVAQAPGSGKSHFLAELGEKIQSLPDLEGQEQKPIVSAFTYNSAMSSKLTHGSFANNNDVDLTLR